MAFKNKCIVATVQGLDWQFNVYCLLPLLLWWAVFSKINSWIFILESKQKCLALGAIAVLFFVFIEIMVSVASKITKLDFLNHP